MSSIKNIYNKKLDRVGWRATKRQNEQDKIENCSRARQKRLRCMCDLRVVDVLIYGLPNNIVKRPLEFRIRLWLRSCVGVRVLCGCEFTRVRIIHFWMLMHASAMPAECPLSRCFSSKHLSYWFWVFFLLGFFCFAPLILPRAISIFCVVAGVVLSCAR